MMNLKPAICLGVALSISSAWAIEIEIETENEIEFECQSESAGDEESDGLICFPLIEREDELLFKPGYTTLVLNYDSDQLKVVLGLDHFENCLSAKSEESKAGGTEVIQEDAIRECELNLGGWLVTISLDSPNPNLRRRFLGFSTARCGSRSSFLRFRCRWRGWICELL